MSSFLGTTSGTAGVGIQQCADDIRLWSTPHLTPPWRYVNVNEGFSEWGYRTPWWPGGGDLDPGSDEMLHAIWYDWPDLTRGANGRAGFTGVTRDVWGTAVAGTVVKLFRTVDDSLQSTTTSATDGTYTLSTPFMDAHYMVAYKDDVIDTAGATVNTLIPA